MKNIFLVIFALFVSLISKGQANSQTMGNDSTVVTIKSIAKGNKGLIPGIFADTAAANSWGRVKTFQGLIIFTTGDNKTWIRNTAANAWLELASSAGTITALTNGLTLTGSTGKLGGTLTQNTTISGNNLYNTAFDAVSSFRAEANTGTGKISSVLVGTDSILFQPSDAIFIIDSLASGASTDSVLVWTQATGRVKKRSYSSFTPTWQQTLTAGSTLTGNNDVSLGTTAFTMSGTDALGLRRFDISGSQAGEGAVLIQARPLSESSNPDGGNSISLTSDGGITIQSKYTVTSDINKLTVEDAIGSAIVGADYSNPNTYKSEILVNKDSLIIAAKDGRINIDTLRIGTMTNRVIGWTQGTSDNGKAGYLTLGSGLSLSSGVLNTSGTVPTPISSLTAATGTNSIDNGTFGQSWSWNAGFSTNALELTTNSTSAAHNSSILYLQAQGANGSSGRTTFGQVIDNLHSGSTSTNVGIKVSAQNATNNYAIIVPASSGDVGIGTSTPTSKLQVVSTQTTGVGNQFSSSTTTSGSIMDITGTSTALAAGNEGLNIGISGANATNGITATGARISVTNTNATSGTNVGLDLTASGATTANNALNIAAGAIALNGSAGTSGQVLTSAGANTLPTWSTPSSGLTVGTTTITSGTTQRLLYDNAGVLGEISVGSSGAFLRSNGTSYGASTLILPNAATSGYIPYATASNTWGESSDFVHTSTEIQNTQSASSQIGFRAKNTSTASGNVNASLFVENSSSSGQLFKAGTNYTTYKNIAASDLGFYNNTSGNISILNDAANINFAANGSSTANMVITSTVITMGIYGAGAATFDASGNISSVSDVRLKNVQGYYNSGLAAIGKIHPIVYKWNEKSHMETEHSYIGFSAQNILSALGNDAIGVNPDGYLSIQDRAIMATLVNAVQEQQKMINDLIKEVKKLKRK